MTPESQRIAIAEVCPKAIRSIQRYVRLTDEWIETREFWNNGEWVKCLNNDPLSDLNAMHEAEKVLTDEQYTLFVEFLQSGYQCDTDDIDIRWVSAPASHRAEAFLRTLSLWTD